MQLTAQPHCLRPVQPGVVALALVLATLLSLVLATPALGNVVTVEGGAGRRVHLLQNSMDGSRDVAQQEEVHRPLQWNGSTLGALLAALLVSALANSAGVGGGAFFVPLFNVVTGFSVKMSTALSQAVIAGGAVGSTAYALSRRHPLDRKRPLVDFELTLMLTPMLLLGVSGGVLLNVMFPTWAITVCLICLLCYLTTRTLRTGLRLHSMEARLLSMQRSLSLPNPGADSRAGSRTASLRAAFGRFAEATAAAAPAPEIAAALAEELSGAAEEDESSIYGNAGAERSPFLSGSAKQSSSVSAAGEASHGAADARGSPFVSPAQHTPGSAAGVRSAPSQLARAASLLSSLSIGSPWRVLESRSSPLDRAGERLGSSCEDDPVGSLGSGPVRIGSSCFVKRELSMQQLPSVPLASQEMANSSELETATLRASGAAGCGDEDAAAAPFSAALGGLAAALRAGQGSSGRGQEAGGAAQGTGQAQGASDEVAEAATSPARSRPGHQQAPQPGTQRTVPGQQSEAWAQGPSNVQAQQVEQGQPGGWDGSVVEVERMGSLAPGKPGTSPFQRLQVHVSSFDRGSGSPSPRGSGERHGVLTNGDAFQAGIHGGDISELQLDDRRFPWAALVQLLLLWGAFLAFQLAKSRLQRCSWGYALLYVAQATGAVGASAFYARQVLRRQTQQQQQALFGDGDLERPILDSTTSTPRKVTSLRQQVQQQEAEQQHGQQAEQRLVPGQAQQVDARWLSVPRPSSDAATASGQGTKFPAPVAFQHPGAPRSSGASKAGIGSHGSKHVWTTGQLGWVLGIVLAGGAVAGLLGIGGGMIVGPLMLELGVHPQASSATSGVMVLFSASVAAVSFAASGRLNVPYAALFGGACLAAAFLGVVVVGRLVKRSGRASLIVLLLAAIMGLGAVLTAVYAGSHAVRDIIHRHNVGFSPFCGT